ncbi:hypothetical protein BJX62DRAFT_198824 [Aspergillus germanicus]
MLSSAMVSHLCSALLRQGFSTPADPEVSKLSSRNLNLLEFPMMHTSFQRCRLIPIRTEHDHAAHPSRSIKMNWEASDMTPHYRHSSALSA